MLPPAPDVEEAKLPDFDNGDARASAAGKPAKKPSLRGNGGGLSALGTGSGDANGESRGGSRESSGKLKARTKSSRFAAKDEWGQDYDDVELSNVRLQPMTDDPAMAAMVDSPRNSKQNSMSAADRWASVQAKTKLVGKMQVDARDSKHYGVELDMSDSFATSHDDVVPEVNRLLYINPDGQFRSGWDIAQVLVLFYLAWVTPYRVGFDAPAYGPEFWFEFLVDIYFIVDVFLNFITGFWMDLETTTVLVSDPKDIAVNYLKTWFLIDIVACAPVDLATRAVEGELACSFAVEGCMGSTSGSVNSNALKLFKLLRVFRLSQAPAAVPRLAPAEPVPEHAHLLPLVHQRGTREPVGDFDLALDRVSVRVTTQLGRRDGTAEQQSHEVAAKRLLGRAVHHERRVRRHPGGESVHASAVALHHVNRRRARVLDHDQRLGRDEPRFIGQAVPRAFTIRFGVPEKTTSSPRASRSASSRFTGGRT
jgi:hypothetical protein